MSRDGITGLAAELFNDVLILHVVEGQAPEDESLLRRVAEWYHRRLKLRSVYVKRFVRARSQLPAEADPRLYDPNPFMGEPAPPELIVRESSLTSYRELDYSGGAVN